MCCSFLSVLLVVAAAVAVCCLFVFSFLFLSFPLLLSLSCLLVSLLVHYTSSMLNLYTSIFFLYISPTLYKYLQVFSTSVISLFI